MEKNWLCVSPCQKCVPPSKEMWIMCHEYCLFKRLKTVSRVTVMTWLFKKKKMEVWLVWWFYDHPAVLLFYKTTHWLRYLFHLRPSKHAGATSDWFNHIVTACERRHPQSNTEGQESRPAVLAKQRAGFVQACQTEQSLSVCDFHRIKLRVLGGGCGERSHVAVCTLHLPALPQQWLRGQTERLFLPQHQAGMWASLLAWWRRSSLTWL